MPRRSHRKLPYPAGFCRMCQKTSYADEIGATLALEVLAKNPPRGAAEPVRVYPCPHQRPSRRYHLTSQPQLREMRESA